MERIIYVYWCHSFRSSPHPLQLDDHTHYTEIKILCAIQRIYLALNLLHFWKFLTLSIMSCLFCLLWTDLVWFSFCLYGTSLSFLSLVLLLYLYVKYGWTQYFIFISLLFSLYLLLGRGLICPMALTAIIEIIKKMFLNKI